MTENDANSAAGRFVRPERTSESQIAELNYREADDLPSVESRQRTAKAVRDFLATHRMTLTAFAALHGVNEKLASKWAEGRANYPGWGFDRLSEDMGDWLFARIRSLKAEAEGKGKVPPSPMPRALRWLRREGTMQDVFAAQQELLAISMSKTGSK